MKLCVLFQLSKTASLEEENFSTPFAVTLKVSTPSSHLLARILVTNVTVIALPAFSTPKSNVFVAALPPALISNSELLFKVTLVVQFHHVMVA